MNMYHVGDLVNLKGTFTDTSSGNLVDATSVTMTVKAPDGTVTTPTPTHVSTGIYQFQQSATQAGVWTWKMIGTGTGQAANHGSFEVESVGP